MVWYKAIHYVEEPPVHPPRSQSNQQIMSTVVVPVSHVQQRSSWDCGISSIMMVLSAAQKSDLQKNMTAISKEEGFLKSTWTIDLAYLLRRFGVQHLYYTVTWGVDPGYNNESFYQKVLTKDEKRVQEKFQDSEINGVQVKKKSISLAEILLHLKTGNPAIVLVNDSFLFCDYCSNKLAHFMRCRMSTRFNGHYIVVCGFNLEDEKIIYRNPSLSKRLCAMPFKTFEKARQSYGTDEDILFIFSRS